MPFLKKLNKKHGPEPERMVTVHVGDGEPRFDRVFEFPASHLTRPRLAPLVAMAEDDHQGGVDDVVRIRCDLGDFVDAMVWTSVEEAEQGRLACGRVVAPSVAPVRYKLRSTFDLEPLSEDHIRARQAMLIWMLDPGSCDPAIFDLALTGDSADVEAAADVFTSQTPEQLATLRQNCKKTTSSTEAVATRRRKKKTWRQKMSECLRIVPSPETPPPPAAISFRPTWCKHMRDRDQEGQPLYARYIKAQQALLQCMLDPAASNAFIRAAATEVINSRLQTLRENGKTTPSADAVSMRCTSKFKSAPAVPTNSLPVKVTWRQRMSERLRIAPSPKTPPPSPAFRPTWARNLRTSVSGSQ
ncbi:hypothetical protein EJB05_51312, partial [Eragrostis curvula]